MAFVQSKLLVPLVGHECASSIAHLDTTKHECFKLLLSKLLSIGIVLGSSIVKLPQIIKLVNANSAKGLSFQSFFLEFVSLAITIAFNVRSGNAFGLYGEAVFINFQNLIIIYYILSHRHQFPGVLSRCTVYLVIQSILLMDKFCPMHLLVLLQWGTIFLAVASKLPQIWQNYASASTGHLSIITVFLQFAGSIARIFTTIQERLETPILASFICAAVLNGVILSQIIVYRQAASKHSEKPVKDSKKVPLKSVQEKPKSKSAKKD